jgi:hypothetical protein
VLACCTLTGLSQARGVRGLRWAEVDPESRCTATG